MPSSRGVPYWLAIPVACLGIVACGLWVSQVRRVAEQTERIARLEEENRVLAARAETLRPQLETLTGQLPAEQQAPSGSGAADPPRPLQESSSRLEEVRLLGQTRDQLAAANLTIADLQGRIEELEATVAQAKAETEGLSGLQEELKEKLSRSERIVDAMQVELKGKTERIVQMEIHNRALHKQQGEAADKLGRMEGYLEDFDELNRRREGYLTSILRRFREVTDQYRNLALNLDEPGNTTGPAGVSLSRIQSAISMADEDLRHLNSLNAQAARLQKKAASK